MAVNTQGTTVPVSFFSCNSDQTNLFSVQPGVPVLNALQMASTFLSVAHGSACQADESCADNSGNAAAYLVTMAKAVIDSIIKGVEFPCSDDRRMQDVLLRLMLLVNDGALIINQEAEPLLRDDATHFLIWAEQQMKGGAQ